VVDYEFVNTRPLDNGHPWWTGGVGGGLWMWMWMWMWIKE